MSVREQFAEDTGRAAFPTLADRFQISTCNATSAANVRHGHFYPLVKRVFDVMLAVPLLVLLAPVMVAIAVLIRVDSAGPAIFFQTRLGRNGKPFTILKFRTMSVVENGPCVVQASRHDARITRFGKILRMSSLDELPQLLNVVRGDMSMVGPRPHASVHDAMYAAIIGHYTLRQRVKPGITGWAQIHGLRGGTPTVDLMRKRVDLDVWYAEHASLRLDAKILLRTPWEVIRPRNAY